MSCYVDNSNVPSDEDVTGYYIMWLSTLGEAGNVAKESRLEDTREGGNGGVAEVMVMMVQLVIVVVMTVIVVICVACVVVMVTIRGPGGVAAVVVV